MSQVSYFHYVESFVSSFITRKKKENKKAYFAYIHKNELKRKVILFCILFLSYYTVATIMMITK